MQGESEAEREVARSWGAQWSRSRRGWGRNSPLEPPGGGQSCWPPDFSCLTSRTVGEGVLVASASKLVVIYYSSFRKRIQWWNQDSNPRQPALLCNLGQIISISDTAFLKLSKGLQQELSEVMCLCEVPDTPCRREPLAITQRELMDWGRHGKKWTSGDHEAGVQKTWQVSFLSLRLWST